MNLAATMSLDNRGFMNPLGAARAAMQGFNAAAGGIRSALAPIAGLAAGFVGVAGAAGALKRAISSAADMEDMQVGFSVLLGSMDAAKGRMAELAKFAAATPFELPEIASASRALETLTRGALSTGKGLTLVGDVAAGVNQPFEEVAVTIGRMYDGLQSGRPVGEAMQRLQELGVISGTTRAKIEQLQASGRKGDEVWNVAAEAMGRFSGMMEKKSSTWNGLMSTLTDNIGAIFREFGTPLIDSLKPALKEAIDFADKLAPQAKASAEFLVAIFKQGRIGDVLRLSIRAGIENALQGLGNLFSAMREALGQVFAMMAEPSFWKMVVDGFTAAANLMAAALMDAFKGPLKEVGESALKIMEIVNPLGTAALRGLLKTLDTNGGSKELRATAKQFEGEAAKGKEALKSTGIIDLQAIYQRLSTGIGEGPASVELKKAFDEISAGLSKLQIPAQAAAKNAPNASPDVQAPKKRQEPEVDRFTKIGLIVGGSGNGADYARRTADNTQKLVDGINKLIQAMPTQYNITETAFA